MKHRPSARRLVPPAQLLYTPEQRRRRDQTPWTLVQGILAPVQFLIFIVSLALVMRYLATGYGEHEATISIILKTLALYTIMITGAIWEKEVFGRYLFADAFYWEDMVSMLVIALHTAYLAFAYFDWFSPAQQMIVALAGYAAYVVNAGQFLLKLRRARLDTIDVSRSAGGNNAVPDAGQYSRSAGALCNAAK